MRAIPCGRVTTYGRLATACGHPGAARMAGMLARCGSPGLPWHRVVRADGSLAWTDGGGDTWQSDALAAEGIRLTPSGRVVDFATRLWSGPDDTTAATTPTAA